LAEFYRFQHVVYETEFAPYLSARSEEFNGRRHGVGDWARRTFGRVMTRRWLNQFWLDYGRQRWQLLLNQFKYGWHLMQTSIDQPDRIPDLYRQTRSVMLRSLDESNE
jgi:hypothetical protein